MLIARSTRTPSTCPLMRASRGAAEQAGWPDDQDEQKEPVDRDVDEIGAEEIDREHLGKPDDEAARNRPPDIAHAADHHGGDALEAQHIAHERMHLAIV